MQTLVSTLQQTHHIFLTLFFFLVLVVVIGEAKLLHQRVNTIQFGIDPSLLFSIQGTALFQTFQQRVRRSSFSSKSSSACGESIGFSLFGLCCLTAGVLSVTPSGSVLLPMRGSCCWLRPLPAEAASPPLVRLPAAWPRCFSDVYGRVLRFNSSRDLPRALPRDADAGFS